ncbi:trifunctional dihydropteroate synthetase [Nowakowskiella sp. JEL0407]|nr:trifunctional dihydropteroate synthetase [Nowakowskiella sp. JEL0407]
MDISERESLIIRDLTVQASVGVDSWERKRMQPLILSIHLFTDIAQTSSDDALQTSHLNYSSVARDISHYLSTTLSSSFVKSFEALALLIAKLCVIEYGASAVFLELRKPHALLHAECAGVSIYRTKKDFLEYNKYFTPETTSVPTINSSPLPLIPTNFTVETLQYDKIFIKNLTLSVIIGVNPWEREEKQRIIINIIIHLTSPLEIFSDHVPRNLNYRRIAAAVTSHVEKSSYKTQESLVESIAFVCLSECKTPKVSVMIEKPSALLYAASAGCKITRDPSWVFGNGSALKLGTDGLLTRHAVESNKPVVSGDDTAASGKWKTAYLALGANVGDTAQNIENALRQLESRADVKLLDTSFLYETAPMYVTDQPNFLNAACKISTMLTPENLLAAIKEIESNIGREPTVRWGPRAIDLDILLYERLEIDTETLTIPHPLMAEREFVLRPLSDIAPDEEHPKLFRTIYKLLALLSHSEKPTPQMQKVIPLPSISTNTDGKTLSRKTIKLLKWGSQHTSLMGILNITPDSFSDGGKYNSDIEKAVAQAEKIARCCEFIDVGGMSTRPGAVEITEKEELGRVVPVIKAIRQLVKKQVGAEDQTAIVSIDTYRASVAEEAVKCGANFVNDVTGGNGDSEMLRVVKELGVPVCLMHMRGNPRTMIKLTDYASANGEGLMEVLKKEMSGCVSRAIQVGIRRWNIVVDPGIGFAKTAEQSLEILKELKQFARGGELTGLPVLVGPSRKRFIGKILEDAGKKEVEADKRVWGTSAAVVKAIEGGAEIVRVHDVEEMKDVVDVADKFWK